MTPNPGTRPPNPTLTTIRHATAMRIYISGKISGREEAAREEFGIVQSHLEDLGHDAVNPFENGLEVDDTWERHLAVDITDLLGCDAVCQLPGWEDSRGARLEYEVARMNGIPALPPVAFGENDGTEEEDRPVRRKVRLMGLPLAAVPSEGRYLPEKTVRTLSDNGCTKLGDLLTYSRSELAGLRGLRKRDLMEIDAYLTGLGYPERPIDIRYYGFNPSATVSNEYAALLRL